MTTDSIFKKVNISNFGLKEGDIFIVKSLLHLINGRNGISWAINSSKNNADVAIVNYKTTDDIQPFISSLNSRNIKLIIVAPQDFLLPIFDQKYAIQIIRSPLRASNFLKCLDYIENLIIREDVKFSNVEEINNSEINSTYPQSLIKNSNHSEHADKNDLLSLINLLKNNKLSDLKHSIDITMSSGWVARINGQTVNASSEFISHTGIYADPNCRLKFHQWIFTSKELPLPIPKKGDGIESIHLHDFFWSLTRLLKRLEQLDIDPQTMIRLAHWPDFSAYPEFVKNTGVVKSASLLINQPMKCSKIMEKSGISEADLTCLIGACGLSGSLEKSFNSENNKINRLPTDARQYTGILGSLRKILGLASGETNA